MITKEIIQQAKLIWKKVLLNLERRGENLILMDCVIIVSLGTYSSNIYICNKTTFSIWNKKPIISRFTGVSMLPFVNNFEILPLQKWAHFCLSCQNIRNQFPSNFLFALFWHWHFIAFIPFLQTTFALTAKQKHELNLEKKSWK